MPEGGTLAVLGLGPVGQFAARIARHLGASRVIGVDRVPERLAMAQRHGIETLDNSDVDDVGQALIEMTDGRGPDGVVEAVGMEAHDSPVGKVAHARRRRAARRGRRPRWPTRWRSTGSARSTPRSRRVRRGGTVSVSGVYGGEVDPMPMMEMFDRGITMRMGQCHVKRWIDDIMPAVLDDADPLGTLDLDHATTCRSSRRRDGYEIFQKKQDGCIKVVLKP